MLSGMSSLRPLSDEALYYYVVVPFIEGAERLNRAWLGVDKRLLSKPELSLQKRSISLLTGAALTFLFLGNILIWNIWQTFGNPDRLSPPFPQQNNL